MRYFWIIYVYFNIKWRINVWSYWKKLYLPSWIMKFITSRRWFMSSWLIKFIRFRRWYFHFLAFWVFHSVQLSLGITRCICYNFWEQVRDMLRWKTHMTILIIFYSWMKNVLKRNVKLIPGYFSLSVQYDCRIMRDSTKSFVFESNILYITI